MENLKYTYNQVNEWIKIADQKALILGSFNMASFIYQLANLDKLKYISIYATIPLVLYILSIFLALFFWLRIIYPKLDNKYKKSKIYFQHIANAYEKDIDLGIDELQNLDEQEIKRDLASQIVINSIIAKKKYNDIQKFIWVFAFQLFLLVLLIVQNLF